MISINIVTSKSLHQNTIGFLYPLIKWKNKIKSEKIKFKINYNLKNCSRSDIIILDSKYHRKNWLNNHDEIYEDLYFLKKQCNKLIFCDTGDSSGWIQTKVFKYIDKYWKLQILKNKKLYLKKFYDGRIYTDYYYKLVKKNDYPNISEEIEEWSEPLLKENLDKIEACWNTSLADYSLMSFFVGLFYKKYLNRIFIKDSFLDISFVNKLKKNNMMFNFNTNYSRTFIAYQRKELNKLFKLENNNRLNKFSYYKKLSDSKICISPFGWGEIAYRDYETFLNQSILLKPNMDHLETWPTLYIRDKTYLDFNWSLTNIREVYEKILDNYEKYVDIGITGKSNYLKYLDGEDAGNKFIIRLKKLLKNLQ